jgi:diguanylate cyclase (GGDEF)-like protein
MKIEIPDSLFEQYKELIKSRFLTDDVSKSIESLIEIELRKFCVSGFELDGLTGTKTRFQLQKDLTNALFGEGWNDNSIYRNKYLCLDIDNFKKFLDFHGPSKGDKILKKIAKYLKEKYSDSNVYRIGGDEFVVEIGELNFTPFKVDEDINLKYSIVDVAVQRNDRKHHANRVIMFNLDKGIVEASENVTKIECRYPENI